MSNVINLEDKRTLTPKRLLIELSEIENMESIIVIVTNKEGRIDYFHSHIERKTELLGQIETAKIMIIDSMKVE